MTTSSRNAYFNPDNDEKRKSHRQIVKENLFFRKTIREVASESGLTYNQVQKRVTELVQSKEVMIVDRKIEEGNENSVYIVTGNSPAKVKKQSIKQFLSEHYPHILIEYNGRNDHRI